MTSKYDGNYLSGVTATNGLIADFFFITVIDEWLGTVGWRRILVICKEIDLLFDPGQHLLFRETGLHNWKESGSLKG